MFQGELKRLIYFSAFSLSFPVTDQGEAEEIKRIVDSSKRNNGKLNITGLLLVHQRWFLQVLEGTLQAVDEIYDRIRGDARNEDVTLIHLGPVSECAFPDWSMCACRLSKVNDEILRTLDLKGPFVPETLTPESALGLLSLIRTIKSRVEGAYLL